VNPIRLQSPRAPNSSIAQQRVLDEQLGNRKFVTGDTLTVADFSLGAALNYAEMAHLPVEPYKEIRRWHDTLSALPAWQNTVAQSALPATAAA
jgi:glutathione S-transferase